MPNALTIALQSYHMHLRWPRFQAVTNRGDHACWTGNLQPAALGATYRVAVAYTLGLRPNVRVLSPELKLHPDHTRLPHVFPDSTLCVHTAHDWRPDLIIATTVLPWICHWLSCYETWLLTGDWFGGGTHPDAPQHRCPLPPLAA